VIRLDAATVLLQWASGGMLFCWFTTRRREVGIGYGWLLRGVYFLLAVGAVVTGLRYGRVPVREVSSALVALVTLGGLVSSVRRRRAGVSGQRSEHDERSDEIAVQTGIERSVRASDKLKALEMLAKYFKLLTDVQQHQGRDDGPVVVAYMPDNGRAVREEEE
jgi:hypothetical protein